MAILKWVLASVFLLVFGAMAALFLLSDRAEEARHWGFIDESGAVVVPLAYDEVRDFSGGYAAVRRDQRWGFIDRDGTEVIEPQFLSAGDFARVDAASPRAWVETDDFAVGYIDPRGRWVIEPRFHAAYGFAEGRAIAGVSVGMTTTRTSGSTSRPIYSFGLIDEDGRWIVEPVTGRDDPRRWSSAGHFSEGRCAVQVDGGLFGYIDSSGNFAIPPSFTGAADFTGGRALVGLPDGGNMVIDPQGASLLDIPVESVFAGEDGYLTVYGSLSSGEGAFLVAPDGGVLQGPFEEGRRWAWGRLPVKTDDGWILIDAEGREYGSYWDSMETASSGLVQVTDYGRGFLRDTSTSGYIDLDGDVVIGPTFNRAGPFVDGRARVAKRYDR